MAQNDPLMGTELGQDIGSQRVKNHLVEVNYDNRSFFIYFLPKPSEFTF
jgi:hypothetical protein